VSLGEQCAVDFAAGEELRHVFYCDSVSGRLPPPPHIVCEVGLLIYSDSRI